MKTSDWPPKGPLVLESGKHAGRALEQVMFLDPRWVRVLFENTCHQGMRQHAGWLLKAGENRRSPVCSHCGKHMADYLTCHNSGDDFSILGVVCRRCAVVMYDPVRQIPLKLSSVALFKRPGDRQRVVQRLKRIWGLKRLTARTAFAFFSAPGREDDELALPP